MPSLTFSSSAYQMLLLHAAAHPEATVTGFLLGSGSDDTATVERIVPLAHRWTTLAAMEDAGLALVEAYLSSSSASSSTSAPLSLLGIYEGPSRANATSLSSSAIRLASKVAQKKAKNSTSSIKGALAVLIRNDLLFTPSQHALETYLISPTSSTTSSPPTFDNGGKALTLQGGDKTLSEAKEAIRIKRLWKEIRDLDDHLEDTSLDWLENKSLVSKLVSSSA